jgi:acyl-CoA thioesterase
VVPRRRDGEPVVRQWVRVRHLEPEAGSHPPLAAIGLLADLVSVGVFRTAARHLEGLQAVSSLDLALQLTGAPLTTWTLLTMATPPIRHGGAIATATLHDESGGHVATAAQHVLVRPLRR